MRHSRLRALLNTWVLSQFRLDYTRLDAPTQRPGNYPPSSLVVQPVQNLQVHYESSGQVWVAATFPYSVTYRFSGTLAYSALPLVDLEVMVLSRLHTFPMSVSPNEEGEGVQFEGVNLDTPVVVGSTSETKGDWLVTLNFEARCRYELTYEKAPVTLQSTDADNPPIVPEELVLNLSDWEQPPMPLGDW